MQRPYHYSIFIKTGSAFESEKESGISHFLEHLLFDQPAGVGDSSLDDLVDKHNIGESIHTTRHYIHVGYDSMDRSLLEKVRGEVKKVIAKKEFEKGRLELQRKVIREEVAYENQRLFGVAYDEMDKFMYKGTELERPILGTLSSLEKITPEQIAQWHDQFFVSENIVEVIFNEDSGEIEISPNDNYEPPRSVALKQKPTNKTIKKGYQSKCLQVAWVLEHPTPREREVLSLTRRILGGSGVSFLYKTLAGELGLSYRDEAYVQTMPGFDVLGIVIFSTKPDQVLDAIESFKQEIARNGVSENVFRVIKDQRLSELSSPDEDASYDIASEYMRTGELILPKERIDVINSITKKEAEELLLRIFENGQYTLLLD